MSDYNDPFWAPDEDQQLPLLEQPYTEEGRELWQHLGDAIAKLEEKEAGFAVAIINTDNPEANRLFEEGVEITGRYYGGHRPDSPPGFIELRSVSGDENSSLSRRSDYEPF